MTTEIEEQNKEKIINRYNFFNFLFIFLNFLLVCFFLSFSLSIALIPFFGAELVVGEVIGVVVLKEMYEIKQREKEQKTKLANEIIKFKEKLQLEDEIEEKGENSQDNLPEIRIDEINDDDLEQHSETSETYTEILANIDNRHINR